MSGIIKDLYGIPVHTSKYLCEKRQIMFPRSKKKRIQKKWRKNMKYYEASPTKPSNNILILDLSLLGMRGQKVIVCHPELLDKTKEI